MGRETFHITEISSAKEITKEKWNELVNISGGTVFHTWEWFDAYENAYPGNTLKRVHHQVVRNSEGEILGILPLLHTNPDPWLLCLGTIYKVLEMKLFNVDSLIVQSWYSFYSKFLTPKENRAIFIKEIEKNIERICKEKNIPYCCFTAIEEGDPLYDALKELGYKSYSMTYSSRLLSVPSSYEDYLTSCVNSKTRYNLNSYEKRLKDFGINEEWVEKPSEDLLREFAELINNMANVLEDPMPMHPFEIIKNIFMKMSKYARLLTFRHNDKLCLGAICFHYDDVLLGCYPGFDKTEEYKKVNLYLNLYRATVQKGIELRCKYIEFGRTGYTYKTKLSIKPVKTFTLVKEYSDKAGTIYKAFEELENIANKHLPS